MRFVLARTMPLCKNIESFMYFIHLNINNNFSINIYKYIFERKLSRNIDSFSLNCRFKFDYRFHLIVFVIIFFAFSLALVRYTRYF
mgnify:CR=1 FL=1